MWPPHPLPVHVALYTVRSYSTCSSCYENHFFTLVKALRRYYRAGCMHPIEHSLCKVRHAQNAQKRRKLISFGSKVTRLFICLAFLPVGFVAPAFQLGPVYTKRQRPRCDNASTSVLIESNGIAPEWGCNPFSSDPIVFNWTELSLQSCHSIDANTWCEWALRECLDTANANAKGKAKGISLGTLPTERFDTYFSENKSDVW